MPSCPNCEVEMHRGQDGCAECGESVIWCTGRGCGHPNRSRHRFCTRCGQSLWPVFWHGPRHGLDGHACVPALQAIDGTTILQACPKVDSIALDDLSAGTSADSAAQPLAAFGFLFIPSARMFAVVRERPFELVGTWHSDVGPIQGIGVTRHHFLLVGVDELAAYPVFDLLYRRPVKPRRMAVPKGTGSMAPRVAVLPDRRTCLVVGETEIVAVDPDALTTAWRRKRIGTGAATMAVQDGHITLLEESGHVSWLDAESGRARAQTGVASGIQIAAGILLLGSDTWFARTDGSVCSLFRSGPESRPRATGMGRIFGMATDGRIVFISSERGLWLLGAANYAGAPAFLESGAECGQHSPPVLWGDRILLTTPRGRPMWGKELLEDVGFAESADGWEYGRAWPQAPLVGHYAAYIVTEPGRLVSLNPVRQSDPSGPGRGGGWA